MSWNLRVYRHWRRLKYGTCGTVSSYATGRHGDFVLEEAEPLKWGKMNMRMMNVWRRMWSEIDRFYGPHFCFGFAPDPILLDCHKNPCSFRIPSKPHYVMRRRLGADMFFFLTIGNSSIRVWVSRTSVPREPSDTKDRRKQETRLRSRLWHRGWLVRTLWWR